MADSVRVTVVAKNPGSEPDAPWMKYSIAAIEKANPRMIILRAATVEELASQLESVWQAPTFPSDAKIALQIVSHGQSGLVHLGSSFWEGPLPDCAFADPFYFLDSNPWALGFLMGSRAKLERVILNACFVGRDEDDGYSINGRTLVYTLCELFQTTVIAAIDETEPDELDANGEYAPDVARHRQPIRWEWRDGSPPTYVDPNPDQELRLKRLDGPKTPLRMKVVEVLARVPARVRRNAVQVALQLQLSPIEAPHLRYAPAEILVAADGGPAALLCNARILRRGNELFAVEDHKVVAQQIAKAIGRGQ